MAIDIYAMITDRIIAQMEKGIVPWNRPWTGAKDGAYSRATGKLYSLLNQCLIEIPGEYATYKQVAEEGGNVKKGAKAKMVVFWKMCQSKDEEEEKQRVIPVLKYFSVFNVATDCEGIEPRYTPEMIQEFDAIEDVDKLANDYSDRTGCKIRHIISNRAYYSPSEDTVTLPLREQFTDRSEYYSTLYHELTHSTGHVSRLNRITKPAAFGSEDYSKEELVAEIGAATILSRLGIETDASFKNNVAYLQNWIARLKNDKRLIVSAASRADKAVQLIIDGKIE